MLLSEQAFTIVWMFASITSRSMQSAGVSSVSLVISTIYLPSTDDGQEMDFPRLGDPGTQAPGAH